MQSRYVECAYGHVQSWERDGTGQKRNQACQNVSSEAPDKKLTNCAQDRAVQALPVDGKVSALETQVHMHRGTRQLKSWRV